MGPLTSRLMQFTEPLAESAPADDKGWCAAIRSVCSRPRLIAVVGDGTGVTMPDFPGEGTAALPVVLVSRALELQLKSRQIAANCIPAASMPGGALALWRNVSNPSIAPAQRVQEWPDLVVQVGATPIAPETFPVPVVRAPLEWSNPQEAANELTAQVVSALGREASAWLVAEAAAASGWHSRDLELFLMEVSRAEFVV